jgi:hypothetical protein
MIRHEGGFLAGDSIVVGGCPVGSDCGERDDRMMRRLGAIQFFGATLLFRIPIEWTCGPSG